MIKSLRAKLALSHLIPTLLLLPILSLYLLSNLEGFYTQSLLHQLVTQSQLLRSIVERDPALTAGVEEARALPEALAPLTDSRVLLLNQQGVIVASSRVEDAKRIGLHLEHQSVDQALRGEMANGVGPGFTSDVAYVVLPLRRGSQVVGALRLSYEVDDVRAQFDQLRWVIIGGTGLTALLALGLALGFATTITRPLRLLSEGARRIAAGDYRTRVSVHSRDEVGTLANSFNLMVQRIEEAETAGDRQLAAIVHEIARPLAGMHAAVETVRDGADEDPEIRDLLLDGVEEELGRLERLIGTLQGVQSRSLRPMHLSPTSVALDRLISATAANFEAVAAQLGITFSVDVPPELPHVRADEDRVIQVLTNLLDNAFKFTPRSGRVTVQVGEEGNYVWIAVADSGVGIAPEELPHIFQQFYRGGESRPPEKRGMGLGLAICREIITAHNGQIDVESRNGEGARFKFTLPKEPVV